MRDKLPGVPTKLLRTLALSVGLGLSLWSVACGDDAATTGGGGSGASGGAGGAGNGGAAGGQPLPICAEGAVTVPCTCGDTEVSSDWCCSTIPSAEACGPAYLRPFYVSSEGDDANDGLSPGTAWRTVEKVNGQTFLPGDAILFRRGDTWRETLVVPSSGDATHALTFGIYGDGAKPRILGSTQATTWTDQGSNVWRSATVVADPYDGAEPAELFFENGDGTVSLGAHQDAIGSLTAEHQWTWASGNVYVYAPTSPDTAYVSVEVPQRSSAMDLDNREYLHLDGLDLRYTRWSGVGYDWQHNDMLELFGLLIENCEIAYIGSWQSDVEQGYGTEVVYSNMTIRNNKVHDCGRRGLAIDMYGDGFTAENIVIEGNELYDGFHTTGVDIDVGAGSYTAAIHQLTIRNNLIYETSPDRSVDASNLIFIQNNNQAATSIDNVFIYGNVFLYPNGYAVLSEGIQSVFIYNNSFYGHNLNVGWAAHVSAQLDTHAVIENNIFYTDGSVSGTGVALEITGNEAYVSADYNLYFNTNGDATIVTTGSGSYSCNQFSTLQSTLGWDTHSPIPADPQWVEGAHGDLHLLAGSPAIGAGVPIPVVTQDRDGQPYDVAHPSLGAYEYP